MSLQLPLWLQYALVAVVVAAALWIFLKKQLPGTVRRLRIAIATPLVRDGRPAWMRRLARQVAPPSSGSASACGGCDNCGPSEPKRH